MFRRARQVAASKAKFAVSDCILLIGVVFFTSSAVTPKSEYRFLLQFLRFLCSLLYTILRKSYITVCVTVLIVIHSRPDKKFNSWIGSPRTPGTLSDYTRQITRPHRLQAANY